MKTSIKIVRFTAIGGVTTLISLSANVILLKYFNTPLIMTYVVIYFSTIILSYLLNSLFTFRSPLSFRKSVVFLGIYLGTMLFGTMLYTIIPQFIKLPSWYFPFFVIPVTASCNYLLSNRFITNRQL